MPERGTILLVEDEQTLLVSLTRRLQASGFAVDAVSRGDLAVERASGRRYDLILLDVNLPAMNGFDVCGALRDRGVRTPILMLTARGQLADRVHGLHIGADDYVTKPFEILELNARIEALLRRARAPERSIDTFEDRGLRIDFRRAALWRDGQVVDLTPVELRLLQYFVGHPDVVLTREELLEHVWGYSVDLVTRTVDVHVRALRQKIEPNPSHPERIITVHGLGYRFVGGAG